MAPTTNYKLYGYCKTLAGLGNKSKCVSFKTIEARPSFIFDVCAPNKDVIKGDGMMFEAPRNISSYASVADSRGRTNGICTIKCFFFLFSCVGKIGITKETKNIVSIRCRKNCTILGFLSFRQFIKRSNF